MCCTHSLDIHNNSVPKVKFALNHKSHQTNVSFFFLNDAITQSANIPEILPHSGPWLHMQSSDLPPVLELQRDGASSVGTLWMGSGKDWCSLDQPDVREIVTSTDWAEKKQKNKNHWRQMQAENIFCHQSVPASSFKLKIETLLIFVPVQITLNLILNFFESSRVKLREEVFWVWKLTVDIEGKNTRTSNVLQGDLVLSCLKKDEGKD